MIAGPFSDMPQVPRPSSSIREAVLPAAAIYGANASGKTNAFRTILFVAEAVTLSHSGWQPDAPIPRKPFWDEDSQVMPSEFEIDFLTGGIRYRYGFRVDSASVLREWLYAFPKGKKQTWFERVQGKPISFGAKMGGENRTIETLTRKNSLFLSAAAQNNHESLLPVYSWIRGLLFVIGGRAVYLDHTINLCKAPDYLADVERLVSVADLGITGLKVEERPVAQEVIKFYAAAEPVLKSEKMAAKVPTPSSQMYLMHRFGDREIPFSLEQESQGTLTYFGLLGPVVDALKKGMPLFVDELDGSLHPLLCNHLIRLFNDTASNPRDAQLIFNTHDTNLLSSGILRRDQVWFTEKNDDASTHLFPLSDFRPRRTENLENGYLLGRYGAIPFVNADAFLSRFEDADVKA